MFKRKRRSYKVGVEQRNLLLEMMLLHRVFNPYDEELIEKIYATGYYTLDEQTQLNDIRRQYIEHERIYKQIDI